MEEMKKNKIEDIANRVSAEFATIVEDPRIIQKEDGVAYGRIRNSQNIVAISKNGRLWGWDYFRHGCSDVWSELSSGADERDFVDPADTLFNFSHFRGNYFVFDAYPVDDLEAVVYATLIENPCRTLPNIDMEDWTDCAIAQVTDLEGIHWSVNGTFRCPVWDVFNCCIVFDNLMDDTVRGN